MTDVPDKSNGDPWSLYHPSDDAPWDMRRVVHLHRRAGFAATWALGKVADQYFEKDGNLEPKILTDLFQAARKEGEEVYGKHKDQIEKKQKKSESRVQQLNEALEAGQISEEEYEKKIERLA